MADEEYTLHLFFRTPLPARLDSDLDSVDPRRTARLARLDSARFVQTSARRARLARLDSS